MPPRAAGRRQPRFSREPDGPSHQNPHSTFQKPNLPPLQGTPSSRRQYSYGAEVEPMRSRPGHGLQQQTQVRDISTAVKGVLIRPDGPEGEEEEGAQEEEVTGEGEQPADITQPQSQREHHAIESEPDELAGGPPHDPSRPSYLSGPSAYRMPNHPLLSSRNPLLGGSDGDDVRSFGIESDLYGDATIDSTPRAPLPQPSPLREVQTTNTTSANNRPRRSARNKQGVIASEDEVELVRQPEPKGQKRPAGSTIGPSPLRSAPRRPHKLAPPPRPRQMPEIIENEEEETDIEEERDGDATEEEEQDESVEDEPVRRLEPQHAIKTNMPAPRQPLPASGSRTQRTRIGGPSPAQPPPQALTEPQRPGGNTNLFRQPAQTGSNQAASIRQAGPASREQRTQRRESEEPASSQDSSESGRWLSRAAATTNFQSLLSHAKFLTSSSPFPLTRRYPTDPNEREAAIQRDIDAAEAELARERRQRAAEEARRRRQQRWHWFNSFNFLRFLNPWNYARGAVWLVETVLNWIMQLIHYIIPMGLWDRLSSVFGFLPHIVAGFLAFVLAFLLATQLAGSTNGDWAPNAIEATWQTLDNVRHRFNHFIPTVTWPKKDRWVDLEGLWDDDSSASDKVEKFLARMEDEFLALKRAGRMHDASLKKLQNVLPSIVHMELADGRPVVSQEFWHALRNLIREDGEFLTFDRKGSVYEMTSERHWRAIASRLVTDPIFTSTLNFTLEDFDTRIGEKMTTYWDYWVKENDDRITKMLGSAVDKIKAPGSQKDLDDRMRQIAKEQQAQLDQQKGRVVTRDEFLRHLRNEFATHRSEIRAGLEALQPQLESLVKQSVDLATKDIPHGMSRADITTLVNGLVHKAFADINLDALAQGTIHRHWDTELRHQINYFAIGSGAIIDAKHSSSTWDPTHRGVVSPEKYQVGFRGSRPFPPTAALDSWQDEGDCWCAARSANHRGNPHGASLAVQLAQRVVPQHIVIEHILPGATREPGARPKVIEVYADIQDSDVRERILDFGAVYFPDDESDWNFTPPDYPSQFVKISQFVYEAAGIHDGVYVHRLSSELMELGAATDHVIVRAVSNYGAENHTCFYRVRLYGFNPELDTWP
ncbi:hypothetical protein QQS21_007523 [Conoideocrella luteorostrata]|uniref:SUN domain-containing protein n=1 Tax=Conoideocrella luteorostrata TaxID=1105319 RepID=A0AAJ0FS01_9HYPO|nr:hypothetical protein QQS21_007523 [Conoideocrella luteorostrata]